MYRHSSSNRLPFLVMIVVIVAAGAIFFLRDNRADRGFISRWSGNASALQSGGFTGDMSLVGNFQLVSGLEALETYNQQSTLQESVADGKLRFFHRSLPNGSLAYFVVQLRDPIHIEVINADGATPGSDAQGDTIWTDGQQHLATVQEMVNAPYAQREGMSLIGAMAFGFHGDIRTSNEGSVVINGTIHRVNPWRSTLCITEAGYAAIGLFDEKQLGQCQQAIGGGPVILWQNKIVRTDIHEEAPDFLPFNPINEDFQELEWRKMIYDGSYPKTAIGVGSNPDGSSYLVMAVSYGIKGVDLAQQLKAMGCTVALGGDDDTSTQATWRGRPIRSNQVREVPDAIAIYVRN